MTFYVSDDVERTARRLLESISAFKKTDGVITASISIHPSDG